MKRQDNIVFKSLRADLSSQHSFPTPSGGWQNEAGWIGPVSFEERALKPHSWGIHLAKADYLIYWLGPRNFVAEYKGQSMETKDIVVSEYARLKQEVLFSKTDLMDLALTYCHDVKDIAVTLDFDWTIGRTMQVSYGFSSAFLKASKKIEGLSSQSVGALADLCAWNAELRHKDATSSFDYVYGCQAVAYASHAISLLPKMAVQDVPGGTLMLKEIAADVRQAISLAVEQYNHKPIINGDEVPPLPPLLAKWVVSDEFNNLSLKQKAFMAVGKWQNGLLLKKARLAR